MWLTSRYAAANSAAFKADILSFSKIIAAVHASLHN